MINRFTSAALILLAGLGIIYLPVVGRTGSNVAAGSTTLVSRSHDVQANDFSANPSVSATGRYVAFASRANNLVAGDTNNSADIFVHDRQTGQTTLVSRAMDSTPAGGADSPSISADGRYIAFESWAEDLAPSDTNGTTDIFVYDRQTGQTRLVTRHTDGSQANSWSMLADISGDGRFVVFASNADNLVNEPVYAMQVYVHDLQTQTTALVSRHTNGKPGNGDSTYPAISADGRTIAFESGATNLVTGGDANGGNVMGSDVFVHNRETGETICISRHSDGTQGDSASVVPSISADGRFVSFQSFATNLIDGDTNDMADIFVHDRQTGETAVVSRHSNGTLADSSSYANAISGNGRYIAFESAASNLVDDDGNGASDQFVHDRLTGQTILVSRHTSGAQGNNHSSNLVPGSVAISVDGAIVIFTSDATNLIDNDTNSTADVFAHTNEIGPN